MGRSSVTFGGGAFYEPVLTEMCKTGEMPSTVRIAQLSDTHFAEEEAEAEGGFAYDTSGAFDAVLAHLGDHDHLDLVVVTGDIADHGRPAQYRRAAEAFARFTVPVNVCPGNHDNAMAYTVGMGRPGVSTSRVVSLGAWTFVFVDSNTGVMLDGDAGLPVDPPGEQRLHSNGLLSAMEVEWIRQVANNADTEHVFLWLHHPPLVPLGMFDNAHYDQQWLSLLADLPMVRGLGGGHTHIPAEYEVAGRPVFVAPSLKHNFSMEPQSWLPPGYRTFAFEADGSITSETHLVDDERWPRRPFGRLLKSLFDGEITHQEMADIVARRSLPGQ